MTHTKLTVEAWLVIGPSASVPGVLQLLEGRLSFTASGSAKLTSPQLRILERTARQPGLAERLSQGKDVKVFDVPLDQVDEVVFRWFDFGGGAAFVIGGTHFRLTFLRPETLKATPSRWTRIGETLKAALRGGR